MPVDIDARQPPPGRAPPDVPVDIDARHLLCPLPVLRLRKALEPLPSGATVRLVATDPAAVIDVPHFCAEGGHELISVEPSEPGARAFIVRRA